MRFDSVVFKSISASTVTRTVETKGIKSPEAQEALRVQVSAEIRPKSTAKPVLKTEPKKRVLISCEENPCAVVFRRIE